MGYSKIEGGKILYDNNKHALMLREANGAGSKFIFQIRV